MHELSKSSIRHYETCHHQLQRLVTFVRAKRAIAVIRGYRSTDDQARAFRTGASNAKPGESKHNAYPSLAVDIAPVEALPLWAIRKDLSKEEWKAFGAEVMEIAKEHKINIRWGGDWDGDGDFTDQKLFDAVHFELL